VILGLALGLAASSAHARIDLGGFRPSDGGIIDGDLGPVIVDPEPPTGGGGGPPSYTVADLEEDGYLCTEDGPAAITCRTCRFVDADESQQCEVYLCRNSSDCGERRGRWGVPPDVRAEDFGLWAKEFAFGADPYWIQDADGDGRRDLLGLAGDQKRLARSRGTRFEDAGFYTGPVHAESAGPALTADVNHDGIQDLLSVSPAGHLQVQILTGSGAAATVELPGTWCGGLGTCLIGDVNGDGMPDLIEVMRGAVDGQRAGDVWVSLASEVPGFPSVPAAPESPDADGDGIRDNADDCIAVPNPTQLDADGDGFGNACDGDLNGDGIVNAADADPFLICLGASVPARPACGAADLDGDGLVDLEDAALFQAALGQPPGPSAAHQPPAIELLAPADGTILPVGSRKAWVAGWVPNAPAGDVQVRVAGQPAAVSGPSNFFTAFVDLPATDATGAPAVFHGIVVEATRGGRTRVERRAVLVGEHAAPGHRAHSALGARLTSAGLERIEQYAREHLMPELIAGVPAEIEGYTPDLECEEAGPILLPVCTTGSTIENAVIGVPDVAVELQPDGVAVFASVPSLDFDLTVHGTGPTPASWSCGGHVSASGIEIALRYGFTVGYLGRVEVVELEEPVVTANVSYGGCGEDRVKAQVKEQLAGFLDDGDDRDGVHQPYQKSPFGGAVEELFASLALSGTFTEEPDLPVLTQARALRTDLLGGTTIFDQDPLSLAYDARFEAVLQDPAGISFWLGAGIEPAEPVPGLGGPSGAYQVPGFTPPALPNALPSGSAYGVAGVVTPNGLNELLDALTRAGVLAEQARVIRQIADPFGGTTPIDVTAGLLSVAIPAFAAYPPFEKLAVHVTPPAFAPVVTGRRGPRGEMVDLHVGQLGITIRDESGDVAVALRADVRVGVDVGFGGSGSGELSAHARGFEVRSFAITENPIGADPAQVALRILCHPQVPSDAFGCALKDQLSEGLDTVLGPIRLPSLADGAAGFGISAQCLQRTPDGSLVAQYRLLLPGESTPSSPLSEVTLNPECLAGAVEEGGGGVRPGGLGSVGPIDAVLTADRAGSGSSAGGSNAGTLGTLGTGAPSLTTATPGTASTPGALGPQAPTTAPSASLLRGTRLP
jgi:hypothetical protein